MTCKHCGQEITLDRATYYVHAATDRVMCPDGQAQAQPR